MAATKPRQGKTTPRRGRTTFGELVEKARVDCAAEAWQRAVRVSRYRRLAMASGKGDAAARLGSMKREAIRRAVQLAPEHVRLSIDDDYQVGLLCVEWRGFGRLHLPAATDTAGW